MLRKAGGGKRPGSRSGLLSDGLWQARGRPLASGAGCRARAPGGPGARQATADVARSGRATWAQVDREPAPPEHRRRAPGPAAPPGCPSSAIEATEVGWSWTRRGRTWDSPGGAGSFLGPWRALPEGFQDERADHAAPSRPPRVVSGSAWFKAGRLWWDGLNCHDDGVVPWPRAPPRHSSLGVELATTEQY
jgi:hypothetical protein